MPLEKKSDTMFGEDFSKRNEIVVSLEAVKQMKFFLFSGFLSGPSQSSLWPGHVQQRHLQLADQVDHGR